MNLSIIRDDEPAPANARLLRTTIRVAPGGTPGNMFSFVLKQYYTPTGALEIIFQKDFDTTNWGDVDRVMSVNYPDGGIPLEQGSYVSTGSSGGTYGGTGPATTHLVALEV